MTGPRDTSTHATDSEDLGTRLGRSHAEDLPATPVPTKSPGFPAGHGYDDDPVEAQRHKDDEFKAADKALSEYWNMARATPDGAQRERPADTVDFKWRIAWETLEGNFVPVVGSSLSSRAIGGDEDAQTCERSSVGKQRDRLVTLLRESRQVRRPVWSATGMDPGAMLWRPAARLLNGLADAEHGPDCAGELSGELDFSEDGASEAPDVFRLVRKLDRRLDERVLVRLQLHLARLLAAATRIWSGGLRAEPMAFGGCFKEPAAKISEKSTWDAAEVEAYWHALLDCLNSARTLALVHGWDASSYPPERLSGVDGIDAVLLSPHIYVGLLQLLGETGSERQMLQLRRGTRTWADEFRRRRHEDAVIRLARVDAGLIPLSVSAGRVIFDGDHSGYSLQLRHLQWIAALIHHTFLAPTRAYRGRGEIAFAVALDRRTSSRSFVPLHASETPSMDIHAPRLGGSDADARVLSIVEATLNRCARTESGALRQPSRVSSALAQLVRWSTASQRGTNRELKKVQELGWGLVLSTTLDLEMEAALAKLGPYCVVLPVWKAESEGEGLVSPAPDWKAESEGEGLASPAPQPAWVMGAFPQADLGTPAELLATTSWEFLRVGDLDSTSVPATNASLIQSPVRYCRGPLVVKLFGSPLHALPSSLQGVKVRHRLRLGEIDLFEFLLQGGLPDVKEITDAFKTRTLVFLGQDASRWDDRAQQYRLSPKSLTTNASERRYYTAGDVTLERVGTQAMVRGDSCALTLANVVHGIVSLVPEERAR